MLKKTVTYNDFNGDEVTEDFYFNLSKAELVEIELSHKGGLAASIQKVIEAEDGGAIVAEFKKIMLMAYGVKSLDGKRFVKNDDLREQFLSSEGYSTIFMELVTDADKAAAFINGIIPAGLADEVAADVAKVVPQTDEAPKKPVRVVTDADVREMNEDETRVMAEKIASGEWIRSEQP